MGVPNPQATDRVREVKQTQRKMGEPLNSETRRVQERGNGNSTSVNLTHYATRTFDIEKGDTLTIETYPDRIVIRTEESDE